MYMHVHIFKILLYSLHSNVGLRIIIMTRAPLSPYTKLSHNPKSMTKLTLNEPAKMTSTQKLFYTS